LVGLVDLWVEVGWIWVGLGPAHGWVGWEGL